MSKRTMWEAERIEKEISRAMSALSRFLGIAVEPLNRSVIEAAVASLRERITNLGRERTRLGSA